MEKTTKNKIYANLYSIRNIESIINNIENVNDFIYYSKEEIDFIKTKLENNVQELKIIYALEYINESFNDLDIEKLYKDELKIESEKILLEMLNAKLQ